MNTGKSFVCSDFHLASRTVEVKGESAPVVPQEERARVPRTLVAGAETEFVAYAVFGEHQRLARG